MALIKLSAAPAIFVYERPLRIESFHPPTPILWADGEGNSGRSVRPGQICGRMGEDSSGFSIRQSQFCGRREEAELAISTAPEIEPYQGRKFTETEIRPGCIILAFLLPFGNTYGYGR